MSAQLGHRYMLENKVFEEVEQVSPTPLQYIMKCMVGGRTMCAENKKHHILDILDAFSLHDEWTVVTGTFFVNLIESLEYLDFSLIKGFLHCCKFVFEVFDGVVLSSLNVFAFIYIAKTATSNQFLPLVLIVND